MVIKPGATDEIKDCIAEGTKASAFLDELVALKPRLVLLETSTPSIKNDLALAAAGARLERFAFDGYVMTAPLSLPPTTSASSVASRRMREAVLSSTARVNALSSSISAATCPAR